MDMCCKQISLLNKDFVQKTNFCKKLNCELYHVYFVQSKHGTTHNYFVQSKHGTTHNLVFYKNYCSKFKKGSRV